MASKDKNENKQPRHNRPNDAKKIPQAERQTKSIVFPQPVKPVPFKTDPSESFSAACEARTLHGSVFFRSL
jgi:hypothetical protein